jgi:cell division protein FtsZ
MIDIVTDGSISNAEKGGACLKVIGVGGAGGNAINFMMASKECEDIQFIAANTDAQALANSSTAIKIQLGHKVTKGLGAGSNPDVGRRAAEEEIELIKEEIAGTDILFLAAGLGGGTGSGAMPVIAQIAREMGILTVAVVTKPFTFEGRKRDRQAAQAIESLEIASDTMIIVPNEKLLEVSDAKISMLDAFALSNSILKHAVKGIADIIQRPGLINVDFADVRSVMREMGKAIMGTGSFSGEDRARKAALQAINSPLLENISIQGAEGILLNITGNTDMGLHEINAAAQVIYDLVSEDANIILGSVIDPSVGDNIVVTVIATGLSGQNSKKDLNPEGLNLEITASVLNSAQFSSEFNNNQALDKEEAPANILQNEEAPFTFKESTLDQSGSENLDTPSCLRRKGTLLESKSDKYEPDRESF